MTEEEDIEKLSSIIHSASDRRMREMPHETVIGNAKEDPAKPKCKWNVESDACDKCKQRGEFIYEPDETPTDTHGGCKCHPGVIFSNAETVEERHRRRIFEAVVVHEDFYDMAIDEVGKRRREYDSELRRKWSEYKAMAKQDGVSPKEAYDSTVGRYFASQSAPGRMSVDSFVDLKDRKGHEVQLAKWFADAGHTVRLRSSGPDGDTNDALIDGVQWEFKRITSRHHGKIVKRVLEHVPRQGPRFVVDLSENLIARDDAERIVAELLDRDGVDEIMLVLNGSVKHFVK